MSKLFKAPFTGPMLETVVDALNLKRAEFGRYCGKPSHAWVSQQIAIKNALTFANTSRAAIGYARARYEKLQKNFPVDDIYTREAKAKLLDQIMAEFDEVIQAKGRDPRMDAVKI